MTASFATFGLTRRDARRLSAPEVAAIPSTWARRLRADDTRTGRPVWRMTFEAAPLGAASRPGALG